MTNSLIVHCLGTPGVLRSLVQLYTLILFVLHYNYYTADPRMVLLLYTYMSQHTHQHALNWAIIHQHTHPHIHDHTCASHTVHTGSIILITPVIKLTQLVIKITIEYNVWPVHAITALVCYWELSSWISIGLTICHPLHVTSFSSRFIHHCQFSHMFC